MATKLSGNLAKSLANNEKLVPHLNQVIDEGEFEWSFDYKLKVEDKFWHPSIDSTPSLFELYTKGKAIIEGDTSNVWVPSHSLRKTFMVGHFWHAYIQHLVVERLHFAVWNEIERKGKKTWGRKSFQGVSGTGDIAPALLPISEPWLVDIKTMGSHDFKLKDMPARFADKWECQLNVYMDIFDLDKAMILGVQKDSPHDFKEFHFTRNQELIDALYLKWKLVSECIHRGVVPPAEEEVELPLKGVSHD